MLLKTTPLRLRNCSTTGDLPGGATQGDVYLVEADDNFYVWDGSNGLPLAPWLALKDLLGLTGPMVLKDLLDLLELTERTVLKGLLGLTGLMGQLLR